MGTSVPQILMSQNDAMRMMRMINLVSIYIVSNRQLLVQIEHYHM